MNALIILIALLVATPLAFAPRVRASRAWKATVTPLSSIMGSGFLVSAPLVAAEAGVYAPLAMAALLLVAFTVGAMIRFNIRFAEPAVAAPASGAVGPDATGHTPHEATTEHRADVSHFLRSVPHWISSDPRLTRTIEQLSHVVLAGAYVISVTYYLQLMSVFVLDHFGVHDPLWSRLLATVVLVGIALIGVTAGLKALERLETYTISLNLGMIAALLVGLAVHDGALALHGRLALAPMVPDADLPHAVRTVMGLLIVVQGFETSRFLGAEHPAAERARTMSSAQILSSLIYVVFVTLMLPLFPSGAVDADVTAIVHLIAPVAMVLPTLVVITAVGSQFSAAVADDAACSGLIRAFLGAHVSQRWAYLLIGGAAIGLTWFVNVLSVISLASRAFALFYALQCAVAAAVAYRRTDAPHRRSVMLGAGLLALLCLAISVLGIPAG